MATSDHALGDRAMRRHGLINRQQVTVAGVSARAIHQRMAPDRWMPRTCGVELIRGVTITGRPKAMAACVATGGAPRPHGGHSSREVLAGAAGLWRGRRGKPGFRKGLVTVPFRRPEFEASGRRVTGATASRIGD